MNKRILTSVLSAAIFMIMAIPFQAQAQWGIGASYELRQESPKSGFGVRVERGILGKVPVVDLRLRAHFSYFREETSFPGGTADLTNYDYGLAAIGGVSIGLIKPYVGLGIGSTTFDAKIQNAQNPGSENAFFWNVLVGAEVSPIPIVNPFVEYRLQQADEPQFVKDSNGRLVFGVTLNF
ncbi:MAG: outer membrane beta-barrel protein [Balneolaceae bacterium]|nr:outer membrane beta-barrel protein [Balneolaceae bacterium]